MSLAIISQTQPNPQPTISIHDHSTFQQSAGFFPDLDAAYQDYLMHYQMLPSAANRKEEQHTQNMAKNIGQRFLHFLNYRHALPDKKTMREFIAFLMANYSQSTIETYLAFARRFCAVLAEQPIHPDADNFRYLSEKRYSVLNAANMSNPKKKVKSSIEGSAYAHGTRLSPEEAQTILNSIDTSTLAGKRDAAIMLVGFYTGFRVAELTRITLNSIQEFEAGVFSITVRAKGNKYEPRASNRRAIQAIHAYVNDFNAQLEPNDPRRIQPDQPVWRGLTRASNIFKGMKYNKPMRASGLSKIIIKRSAHVGLPINPHDLRRTWAAWAESMGMPEDDIQGQMLHEDIKVTRAYIAKPKNVATQDIAAYGLALTI